MKYSTVILCCIILACAGACTDDGGSDGNAGADDGQGADGEGNLDWHTSSCGELGGVEAPLGACLVECPGGTCPTSQVECSQAPGLIFICRVTSCTADADCGPEGWYCRDGYCSLTCNTVSGGAQSPECPTGWECYAPDYGDDRRPYCAYGVSGGDCGVPCPEGCCSPSGLTCCEPPFCSGDCVGSPCCS